MLRMDNVSETAARKGGIVSSFVFWVYSSNARVSICSLLVCQSKKKQTNKQKVKITLKN